MIFRYSLNILPRFHVLSTCPIVHIIINPKTIKRPSAIRRVHPHGRHHIRCNYLHPFFPSRHHPSLLFNMWCYGHIHSLLNEFLFCFFWSSLHLSARLPCSNNSSFFLFYSLSCCVTFPCIFFLKFQNS